MYQACFGFDKRPFPSLPRSELYVPGTVIQDARETLARCIERSEGVGMLVGPSGTGKTLLCQMLAEQFEESLATVVLSGGRISTRRNLFQAVLYGLGKAYRGMDEGEARLSLVDYLTLDERCPDGMLLLVDEAHTLPLRLIDELRMLTDVSRDGRPMVRLVLAGSCLLEERLASPKLDSFSQRIVARCYLEPFNRSETRDYIRVIVKLCGGSNEELFDEETSRSVYQATDGVPRLINQLCDHALLLVYAAGREAPIAGDVEEAWADLQQLPTPLNDKCDAAEGVIEFGGLEEQFDENAFEERQEPEGVHSVEGESSQPQLETQLRVDPHTNPAELEPAEQLERIEQTLSSLDGDSQPQDFQPAGSIGPEVELLFDDPPDSFGEKFEEEEVIADRYATSGSSEQTPAETVETAVQEDTAEEDAVEESAVEPCVEPDIELSKQPRKPQELPEPETVPLAQATARRREYGRLFASLRQG